VIVKTLVILSLTMLLIIFSCNRNQQRSPLSFTPKVVKAHGYTIPKDSMAEPKVIPAGKPTVVRAGTPKVVPTNTNVNPAGIPRVVIAGVPRVCTPGKDSFSLPKTVPAIDSPFIACIPEVVIAKEPHTMDRNPQNFSSFSIQQGLKSAAINCLMEDKSGNLWIGTSWGASKYDGKTFTHYTKKEGLISNWVMSICEDTSGNLWFGTYNAGVSKYDGRNFTNFTIKEGLGVNSVLSILDDKSGNLWFGTRMGVIKYDGKSFTHFTEKEGFTNYEVWSMLRDKSDNIWFGTRGGGVIRYDGSFTHFTEKEGLTENAVFSILEDKKGNLWFGTGQGGVSRYDRTSFTNFKDKEGLSGNDVRGIIEDKSEHFWFGTNGGVSEYDGKSFTHFTEKEGLSDNAITCTLKDKRGNFWFGTQRGGVNKYGGKRFTHFTKEEGLSDNIVRTILQDNSGNLWFGTVGGGVNRYDGKSFTHFTTKEGLPINHVRTMLEDKSGNLWFGGWDGVSKYDPENKSFTYFKTERDMSPAMLQDKSGIIWFGSYGGGVFKYDGKSFTHFTTKEGLSNNIVVSIKQDKSGALWFGTFGGGMSRYQDKSFTHFTEKEGLSDNYVFTIREDKYGNIWAGSLSGGVSKYDGEGLTHFTQKEGLSNNTVSSIMEDKSGNLWFGSPTGLSKLEKNKIDSGFSDSELLFKTYTYEDGFLGIGVNTGETIYQAKDGTIWIGAGDRLTAYHPDEDTPDTIPPDIQLTGLTLFNENIGWQNLENKIDTSIALGNGVSFHDFHFDNTSRWYGLPEHLSLAYNNNYVTFQFVGITTQSPKKVKYQYKLEGLDENWSALTNRSEAQYSNLLHGQYTFKVKAMNGDGYWSKEFSYSFTIRPPWWRTWWFTTLVALVAVGGVYGFIQYRSRNLKQRNILLENKVTERTHELNHSLSELKNTQDQLVHSEKMASLGELTSGIAHEIKNPLNFISNFSELNLDLISEIEGQPNKNPEAEQLLKTLKKNSEKINHHGKRVDDIVKSMLQHSRVGNLAKEPINVNALCEESLKLAYHGFKAKEKTFQASFETRFEPGLPTIMAIPQEFSRVLLNLFNNAFYAVHEKKKKMQPVSPDEPDIESSYEPMVTVSTKRSDSKIVITISDNGIGIPQRIISKIFQPFFTTKPTGEGTGLGLSMSYDIITKSHGGELHVKSTEGEGTDFEVYLPAIES